MIEDLRNPAAYPEYTQEITVVQTHISIVFLGDEFVYKVKKPVNFGFLDFSTLEKRRFYCHQEVRLNRRLSRDLYLDVVPITFFDQRYHVNGHSGEAREYAVKMRRIPDEKIMKAIFLKGELTADHLKRIAGVLAEFHLNALGTPEIDQYGELEKFKFNTDENFRQVERYLGATISSERFSALRDWTEQFYRDQGPIFRERVAEGHIRDCHGDLHMEHICLTESLPIFDCIEFNERFRYSDTLADIAFLLMDLEYHGGKAYAQSLWDHYKTLTGEKNVESLLTFYKVYRAFVRGKVISFQLDDPDILEAAQEVAIHSARHYFNLAYEYIS